MGTPKTQLLKRDRYGALKAAELAAEMLADYERARDGIREIRVEEITQEVWDDVVVYRSAHTDRWQVKRQLAALDVADARKLVSGIVIPTPTGSVPVRLHIGLAALVAVGTGTTPVLETRKLAELCDGARAPNVDPSTFAQVHKDDAAYKFVVGNLATSTSVATVVAALGNLTVHELGTEGVLRTRAVAHLTDLFTNASDVVTQLHNWLMQHADGAIRIDANVLHAEVIDKYAKRDAGRARWVHLSRNGSSWETRGPVPVADIVEGAWGATGGIRVQIGSKPFVGEAAAAQLARLLLHRSTNSSAEAADGIEWQTATSKLCGDTLGVPSRAVSLACVNAPAVHPHPPRFDQTSDAFAAGLAAAMNAHVWREVLVAVPQGLHAVQCAADVRTAALALWDRWLKSLATAEQRANLCRSMLVTAEESARHGLDGSLRNGPLLVNDLGRALMIALVIGVGFEAEGATVSVSGDGRPQNLLIASLAAHVIAVSIASHPRRGAPCRFVEDPTAMLADETGMAILAGVEASATDLYGIAREASVAFHATEASASNLNHQGLPVPLLTASARLLLAMAQSIDAVRKHVVEQVQQMAVDRSNELKRAVTGASANG